MKESERVSSSHKNFAKKYSSSSKNKYPTSGTYKAPSAMFQTHRKLTSTAASAVARFVSQQDLVRNSVFMFTDGSCLGNRNVATNNCPAGWGVVVVKFREEISARMAKLDTTVNVYEPQYLVSQLTKDKCDIVAELCGPVTVSTQNSTTAPLTRNDDANGDDLDNSIDVASNNTGELCAMAKAMIYMKKNVSPLPKYCFILYDSEYAAKSITGEFNGPKNQRLIQKSRSIKHQVETLMKAANGTEDAGVVFVKVKAHNNNYFNDIADRLANMGSAGNVSV